MHPFALYLIETPFSTLANRADPDQAALVSQLDFNRSPLEPETDSSKFTTGHIHKGWLIHCLLLFPLIVGVLCLVLVL